MKHISIIPFILVLAACSNSPGNSDVKNSLTAELTESCPYVTVSNVKVKNVISPSSSNDNIKEVSFSADVEIKFTGKVADQVNKYKKAKELYDELHVGTDKINKSFEPSFKELKDIRDHFFPGFRNVPSVLWIKNNDSPEVVAKKKEETAVYLSEKWNTQSLFPLAIAPSVDDSAAEENAKFSKMIEIRNNAEKELTKKRDQAEGVYIQEFVGKTGGLLSAQNSWSNSDIWRVSAPGFGDMPSGCSSLDQNTIIGLVTRESIRLKGGDNWDGYMEGTKVGVESTRQMVKSSNGWVLR